MSKAIEDNANAKEFLEHLSDANALDAATKTALANLLGVTSQNAAVTVADAATRKTALTYTALQLQVGGLKVKQTDMPGVLWFLIAADVTLDASWFAAADAEAAGVRIFNTTTETYYTLTLTGTAGNEYPVWTPE